MTLCIVIYSTVGLVAGRHVVYHDFIMHTKHACRCAHSVSKGGEHKGEESVLLKLVDKINCFTYICARRREVQGLIHSTALRHTATHRSNL